jgi:hypothetical protein
MRVLDFIWLMDPDVTPDRAKIHLATWNGKEDPLDEYRAGRFDEWQRRQTKRNFERPYVISLISLPGLNRWLYAGVHSSDGYEQREDSKYKYYYRLQELHSCAEFNGRLVVIFARQGRNAYRKADELADQLIIGEILPVRHGIPEFPGFRAVDLAKAELDLIVAQGLVSWRTALSNAAGVYLVSDTVSGKLYVGKADGEGGIWQRWCAYAETGHGGNIELRQLMESEGPERARAFRFSILEIADIHTNTEVVSQRESHWKNVLLTRTHGLNAN